MDLEAIRKRNLSALSGRGFQAARSLPLQRASGTSLRPIEEVAARFMAMEAVFTWAAASGERTPTQALQGYVRRNDLQRWMTAAERKIFRMERTAARRVHQWAIGWKLENMWPLAWILGFRRSPTLDGAMISQKTIQGLIDMLPRLGETTQVLLERAKPRRPSQVVELEDRFYCCHNAVRSAQLGGKTVPEGFDPVAQGGVVHERRHALTWALSPKVSWDKTDLST